MHERGGTVSGGAAYGGIASDLAIHTIPALFDRAVRIGGAGTFLQWDGGRLSFSETAAAVERVAANLSGMGIGPGDRIGLLLSNGPHYVVALLAALRIGAIGVGVSTLDAATDTYVKIADCSPKVIVAEQGETVERLRPLIAAGQIDRVFVAQADDFATMSIEEAGTLPQDHIPFRRLLTSSAAEVGQAPAPQDIAILQYTGGTSGTLKAAIIEHHALVACGDILVRSMPALKVGRETVLVTIPLVFAAGVSALLIGAIATASRMILHRRFDAARVLDTIAEQGVTWFSGVPTIYTGLLAKYAGHDLSSLKYCLCGSAPLALQLRLRFEETTGCRMVEGYAMSECVPITVTPDDGSGTPGSVGRPCPGIDLRIRRLDDPASDAEPGEVGQIAICGPMLMRGYWNRSDADTETFVEGYFLTGDTGVMRGGELFLSDRLKDVIITSGVNVYPTAVEDAIYEHPAVEEVIVIGLDDAYRGQMVAAFVKRRAGVHVDVDTLATFLDQRLSKHQMPRRIVFREALPRTDAGKLSRRALLTELGAEAVKPA